MSARCRLQNIQSFSQHLNCFQIIQTTFNDPHYENKNQSKRSKILERFDSEEKEEETALGHLVSGSS